MVLSVGVSAAGCSASLPRAPASAHTEDELVEVPFPPPVVRSDVVPPRPNDAAVWVDGEWVWQVSRWSWHRGAWVVPPAGATFARWETQRRGAQVLHAPSVFHLVDGGSVAPADLEEGQGKRRPTVPCAPPASSTLAVP